MAGGGWMRTVQDRDGRRSLGEALVQQWMAEVTSSSTPDSTLHFRLIMFSLHHMVACKRMPPGDEAANCTSLILIQILNKNKKKRPAIIIICSSLKISVV